MKVVPFIAENAAAALAQIHEQLGPDAVVLSVRPLPSHGLARFWQKNRSVEVIACAAEEGDQPSSVFPHQQPRLAVPCDQRGVFSARGNAPALHDSSGRPHVFVGPPGTGKTTLLCKWMTLSVLNENRSAKVWRLDGTVANTAEFLNVYGEMLGVPVERFVSPVETQVDLLLVDLPGVQSGDADAMRNLSDQLAVLPSPRVHLVLNAAYEISILSEQFHAFAQLQPEDVSFCHLDEERRQGKLLDFILGTNCSLRFLSTGQKIPGDFFLAGAPAQDCAGFAG
jgi:flagellar biosynthesis GTPase FlhF